MMKRWATDTELDAELRAFLRDEAESLVGSAAPVQDAVARLEARVGAAIAPASLRLTWLMVAVALLLTAVVTGLLLGQLRSPAEELVRRSRDVHAAPPPFVLTVGHDPRARVCSVTRYVYDGAGRLRTECYWDTDDQLPASPEAVAAVHAGAKTLPDGLELWQYTIRGGASPGQMLLEAGSGEWLAGQWQEPQPPAELPEWTIEGLNWHGWFEFTAPHAVDCNDWRLESAGSVAGRPAQAVRCGEKLYWIDEGSALLVRVEVAGQIQSEALALDVGAAPPGVAFGPLRTARLALIEGQPAPEWTLPGVDGEDVKWSSLLGRPMVVMWASGCSAPCLDPSQLADLVRAHPGLGGLVIADPASTTPTEIQAAVGTIPLVIDDGSRQAWTRPDGFAFFAADGTTVGFSSARSASTLEAAASALLSGLVIPTPPPGEGTLALGHPVPPLSATLVGGAALRPDGLAGRPMVLLVPPPAPCAQTSDELGAGTDATRFEEIVTAFATAHRELGDRASFVLVGTLASRRTCYSSLNVDWPAIVDDLRAAVGSSVEGLLVVDPLAFWNAGGDGQEPAAWGGLTSVPTLVVTDARGRLVEIVAEDPAVERVLDDLADRIRSALDL